MQQNDKPIPLEQLRAWDILGESPVLYTYDSPKVWTVPWLYKWQLKGGVLYHTESGGEGRTRKSSTKSLATCIVRKKLYLTERE